MAKTLGDLRKALEGLPDDLVLFISDGHEGISQFHVNKGVVSSHLVDDFTYVHEDTQERRYDDMEGLALSLKRAQKDPVRNKTRIEILEKHFANPTWVPAVQIDTGC